MNLAAALTMHVKRGECLIINQIHYAPNKEGEIIYDRGGTLQDEEYLIKEWEKLGCRIHVERDLTKEKIKIVLKKFRDEVLESNKPDFMVLVILGHGRVNPRSKLDEILGIDFGGLPTDHILEAFVDSGKCPAMKKKPKLNRKTIDNSSVFDY